MLIQLYKRSGSKNLNSIIIHKAYKSQSVHWFSALVVMSGILALPEGCIAAVFSFTSPRDVCRLACVSTTFRSAADSDVVWNRFLRPEYLFTISDSRSVTGLSKKELYLRTCNNLIHNGKLSFWFDLPSRKKCYMISPRELNFGNAESEIYWKWFSIAEAQHQFEIPIGRFPEVVMRGKVPLFQICGKISTSLLSPMTTYKAYLVFAIDFLVCAEDFTYYQELGELYIISGEVVGSIDSIAYFPREPQDEDEDDNYFIIQEKELGEYFKKRADGWLECELGEFFNRDDEEEELLMTIKGAWYNKGLLVQGIEIRPQKE